MKSVDYNKIFEASLNEIYVFSASTWRFIEVNRGGRENLGYSMEALRTLTPLDIKPEYTKDSFQALVCPLLAGEKEQIIFETVHRRRDGTHYGVEVHLHLSTIEGEQVFVAIILDITQRQHMESVLRMNERMLSKAQEVAHLGSWELNFATGVNQWSDEFFRICGLVPGSVPPSTALRLSLVHPEDRDSAEEAFAQSQKFGVPYNIEKRIIRPTGEIRWVVSQGEVSFNEHGTPAKLTGTFLDITDRKQMEESVRTSESQYRSLVENSQNAIALHLPDGRFTYANPTHVELFGYPTETLYALTPDELTQLVHPDDITRTRDEAHQQAIAGNRVTHLEYRARHQAGHFIWVEAFATPIFNEQGQVIQILSSLRDISERKLAHQRAFEMALEKERIQLLRGFIQNAAHEFRTPLSIIGTGAYIAGRTENPDQRQSKLTQIDQEVGRINKLVDSMLLITKLETSGLAELRLVSLSQIIEEADRKAKRHYPNRGAIAIHLPTDLPTLLGDESCLTDAFYELLDNAYRFNAKQGVISLTAYRDGQQVVVDIRDQGAGIAEAELAHIFDVFWRQDKAHSTPGFGLGLSIALKIIQLHGGDISVTSTLGVGTNVRVILPIAPSNPQESCPQ